jgi:hypothetical protein
MQVSADDKVASSLDERSGIRGGRIQFQPRISPYSCERQREVICPTGNFAHGLYDANAEQAGTEQIFFSAISSTLSI